MAEGGRTADKRRVIIEAATSAFLRKGFLGTSMDEIAAAAAVSKQTVYKHFADKENLFREIIGATVGVAHERVRAASDALAKSDDPERELRSLAQMFISTVVTPEVLALRRLIIGEAARFPELGQAYWDRAFDGVLGTLAEGLEGLARRGLLRVSDAKTAAAHFAGLILWIPMNRVMFCGPSESFTPAELERMADDGIAVFLAAYSSDRLGSDRQADPTDGVVHAGAGESQPTA